MKKLSLIKYMAGLLMVSGAATAADLGNGFIDHGVCSPVSSNKGATVATDADGNDMLVCILADYRGANGIYTVTPATGKQEFFALPFAPDASYAVFSSLYSSGNRYYSLHSSRLTEFDPAAKKFRVFPTHRGMGMAMTEADDGTIWTVTYPDSGLVGFHPETGRFRDFGPLRKESWAQYHRTIAADDAGWLYFGVGNTRAQLVAYHPENGKKVEVFPENERPEGACGVVFRAENGKVYGTVGPYYNQRDTADAFARAKAIKPAPQWYEFHRGESRKIDGPPQITLRPVVTGSQGFYNYRMRDGWKVDLFNPVERRARFIDPQGKSVTFNMEYPSEGAHISTVAATSDGLITGGTSFPMRNYVYNPADGTMINRNGCVQWNTVLPWKNHVFVGGYNGGYLFDWRLDEKFDGIPRFAVQARGNPRYIAHAGKALIRPHVLKITPDGRHLLMGGTPEYGHTGGGLAVWDRESGDFSVVPNRDLIENQSVYALAMLPDGRIFGGTTVEAGTGGKVKSKEARFFQFDLASRRIVWSTVAVPGAGTIHDLTVLPDGKILGIADKKEFFVFDPAPKQVVRRWNSGEYGLAAWQQGPRMFVRDGDDIYVLFKRHIVKVDPERGGFGAAVASPIEIHTGGDCLDGRVYFASGSRLYSCRLPDGGAAQSN